MLDFLAGISNAIVTIFQLLINLISGMVQLVALSIEYIAYLMLVLGRIPIAPKARRGGGILPRTSIK